MALYGSKAIAVGRDILSCFLCLIQASYWIRLKQSNFFSPKAGCAVRLLSSAIRTRQMQISLPSVIRRNWISVGISGGLCAVPFVQDHISHEALIRRASSLVTDSANTFLSQTTLALVDSLTLYTKAVHTLITLHKQYVSNIKSLSPADERSVWEMIVHQREMLIKYREDCKQFERKWTSAISLSQLAAETAFNAGADQASVLAQANQQIAQSQVEQAQQHSLEAEQKLKDSKAEFSKRLQSSSPEVSENEEEIPDEYLRED